MQADNQSPGLALPPAKPISAKRRGFALVITLSLMILLTVLAVGLLTLSSVQLRQATAQEAHSVAMANARLGLMLAIGQLQKNAGDDRRVTADASIFDTASPPTRYAVGVWKGWSPNLGAKALDGSQNPAYAQNKGQNGFLTWLVSAQNPADLKKVAWGKTDQTGPMAWLFDEATCGFKLGGQRIPISQGSRPGAVAWAVSQENTKAKINIPVDEKRRAYADDRMQAPSRPNLALSTYLKQPENDWPERAGKVLDMSQVALDTEYGADRQRSGLARASFTTDAYSLLTNCVNGGLKVDLTTGFDLTDSEFEGTSWSGVKNPFRASTPRNYSGQKPLWAPLVNEAEVMVNMSFDPASVLHRFPVNGVPTYDTLRAHYRAYRHLYSASGGTTAFERPYSHIAMPRVTGRPWGRATHPSLRPVLDRISFIMSLYVDRGGFPGVLLSPVVTVWNPYNVALECDGMVAYPWIDFPLMLKWNCPGKWGWSTSLSRAVSEGYQGHGRSSRPYFYLHLTETGSATPGKPIHLDPGEVRVFCLADPAPKKLETKLGARDRTWRMKAVGSASELANSTAGGVLVSFEKTLDGDGKALAATDALNAGTLTLDRAYNNICCLADGWQIRNPDKELMVADREQLLRQENLSFIGEVLSLPAGAANQIISFPALKVSAIQGKPYKIGNYMTYHRTALSSTAGSSGTQLAQSDLMYTVNPRGPYVNQYLSGGTFAAGPHYETTLVGGNSLTQLAMETSGDGKRAYYGASHSAYRGRSQLPFFEIPRSPTLSLGNFQHCDITGTAFASSSQIANSWASPYLPADAVYKRVDAAPGGEPIRPRLAVYDNSYLANEALYDSCYMSGAAPVFDSSGGSAADSEDAWSREFVRDRESTVDMLGKFFKDPAENPLRNPRMVPYYGSFDQEAAIARVSGPERCVNLAAQLMVDGGFNINSTNEEAWTSVLASLRGEYPASGSMTAQSRFRHVLKGIMSENDPWSGFRSLGDKDIKAIAKNLVAEIKERGPFLSLGEFVNRRVGSPARGAKGALNGAIQAAIDKEPSINSTAAYSAYTPYSYPSPENIPSRPTNYRNTGAGTPGWLTQADVLHALSPFISARSDSFIIRSVGEARDAKGNVTASACLEAVVQRVPDWVDAADGNATAVADLKSKDNQRFGRRFMVVSVKRIPPPVLAKQ